ncbi:hypothetical protein [Frankia sp. CcI49]|uniref:hypothetical protein n=1 Tax=Frankia sp. CcI49 TaxID=1745382 RepID=UPI0010564FBC|nr:hypothetical protein [Frankia sp. CcI49]
MASVKQRPTKRKPLSTYDLSDPRFWIVGGWRLGLGSARVSVVGRDRWRTWGDIATPVAGAGSLYLLSALGADPLGPLGPTLLESDLFDLTDPYRLTAAALGGTAALLHQRSDTARGHRERRAVLRAFAELNAGEGPTLLHPSGRPVQVKLPEPTLAGARFVMKIPDGVTEAELLQAAQRLAPMLKGRVSMRPTVAPASGRKVLAALASGAATKTVTVARRARTVEATEPKPARNPLEEFLACSHVEVNIRRRETLNTTVPWEGLEEIRRAGANYKGRYVQDPWHIGRDEDGKSVYDTIFARNKLSGGEAGSGKSTGEHVDICAVSQDPRARNFFIDPSGGAEFGFWEPLAAPIKGRCGVAYTVEDAYALLRDLHAEGVAALQRMADTANEREAAGLPRTNVARGETTTWIWIDELLALTRHPDKKLADAVSFLLFDIIGRLRKVGYHVVCSTLKPTGDVIPTFVRDLITIKQVFRCTTADASTAVLGDKIWALLGYGGHKIEMKSPKGINYLLGTEGYPLRMRSAFVDNEVREGQEISERHEVLNAALRLRGLPEVPPLVMNVDPERAALLDPSRPPARESVILTPPASDGVDITPVPAQRVSTAKVAAPTPAPAPVEVEPEPSPNVAETEEVDSLAEVLRVAAEMAVEAGHLTPRMLQVRLGLDFDACAWVLGQLTGRKVIGSASGDSGARKALASAADLDRLLADKDEDNPPPPADPTETARAGYAQRQHRRRPDKRTRSAARQTAGAGSSSKEG